MTRLILQWMFNALALWIVAHTIRGFQIDTWMSAFVAVVVIGLLNATFGLLLKVITLPLSVFTFGIFLLVINAAMLKLASHIVPGFRVQTFGAAFIGAFVLGLLHWIFGYLMPKRRRPTRAA